MKLLLDEYSKALASLPQPMEARFAPPAGTDSLRRAEEALGCQLPGSLAEFLLAADGQQSDGYAPLGDYIIPSIRFAPGEEGLSAWGYFLGLEAITELSLGKWEDYEGEDPGDIECFGPVVPHYRHLHLSSSTDDMGVCCDLQPAEGGRLGQIVTVNGSPDRIACLAPTMEEFIRIIIDGIRRGRFRQVNGILVEA